MGLFSSHHKAQSDIPADILADVSVNGQKSLNTQSATSSTPVQNISSNSPFLKSKTETTPQAAEPAVSTMQEAVQATEPTSPISYTTPIKTSAPKDTTSFPQANEPGVSERVRFPKPEDTAVKTAGEVKRPDFAQITQDQALTEKQREHLTPLKTPREAMPEEKKSLLSSGNVVSIVVFVLILGFISGGSWYYLNTRNGEEVTPEASIDSLEVIETVPEVSAEKTILINQPNYLVLDIESVTLPEIKALLEAEKEKMVNEGVNVPVEYLVMDMNNNPVAFSRFALLIDAGTPADLVTASLEPFSLYLYVDQGELRMALAIALRADAGPNFPVNKNAPMAALKKFFYPEALAATDVTNIPFNQSTYQRNAIFYANLDESANYSFDISQQEGILTLANSKNVLRAVVDKRLLVPEL